jgi:hypothetical protein
MAIIPLDISKADVVTYRQRAYQVGGFSFELEPSYA